VNVTCIMHQCELLISRTLRYGRDHLVLPATYMCLYFPAVWLYSSLAGIYFPYSWGG